VLVRFMTVVNQVISPTIGTWEAHQFAQCLVNTDIGHWDQVSGYRYIRADTAVAALIPTVHGCYFPDAAVLIEDHLERDDKTRSNLRAIVSLNFLGLSRGKLPVYVRECARAT
jgi:hypothetical protein